MKQAIEHMFFGKGNIHKKIDVILVGQPNKKNNIMCEYILYSP